MHINFPLFFGFAIPLLLIPGPAVIFISAQSVSRGIKYGVASAAGIALGGVLHIVAATLGLSAILAALPTAFATLKYLGAAYLVYLGVSRLLQKTPPEKLAEEKNLSPRHIFFQGVWVQVLNPKIALFFLSFLPQFIDLHASSVPLQTFLLGTGFVILGFTTDSLYAILAANLQKRFTRFVHDSNGGRWLSGLIFIGLGIYTALGSFA